jgi:hypothetical protein
MRLTGPKGSLSVSRLRLGARQQHATETAGQNIASKSVQSSNIRLAIHLSRNEFTSFNTLSIRIELAFFVAGRTVAQCFLIVPLLFLHLTSAKIAGAVKVMEAAIKFLDADWLLGTNSLDPNGKSCHVAFYFIWHRGGIHDI